MLLESAVDSIAAVAEAIPIDSVDSFLKRMKTGEDFETALILEAVEEPYLSALRSIFLSAIFFQHHALLAALIEGEYRRINRAALDPVVVWTGPKLDGGLEYRKTSSAVKKLVDGARTRVLIAGYHATSEALESMGVWKAIERGAEVVLMVSGDDLKKDDRSIFLARGIRLESIVPSAGTYAKFHIKAIVADSSRAIVGSANFTALGQNHNVELGLLVEGQVAATIDRVLRSYLVGAAAAGWTVK